MFSSLIGPSLLALERSHDGILDFIQVLHGLGGVYHQVGTHRVWGSQCIMAVAYVGEVGGELNWSLISSGPAGHCFCCDKLVASHNRVLVIERAHVQSCITVLLVRCRGGQVVDHHLQKTLVS